MAATTLKSPTTGKTLIPVATPKTTPVSNSTAKTVEIQRVYIEVIVSDSRLVSQGSQWGHAAIVIDGKVYSRAHPAYFTTSYDDYVRRNSYRDSIGLVLWLSSREMNIVQAELEKRVTVNAEYSVFSNSCSTNVADVLELVGIMAHDPRFLPTPVTPGELLAVLSKSNRLAKKIPHPMDQKKHEKN